MRHSAAEHRAVIALLRELLAVERSGLARAENAALVELTGLASTLPALLKGAALAATGSVVDGGRGRARARAVRTQVESMAAPLHRIALERAAAAAPELRSLTLTMDIFFEALDAPVDSAEQALKEVGSRLEANATGTEPEDRARRAAGIARMEAALALPEIERGLIDDDGDPAELITSLQAPVAHRLACGLRGTFARLLGPLDDRLDAVEAAVP